MSQYDPCGRCHLFSTPERQARKEAARQYLERNEQPPVALTDGGAFLVEDHEATVVQGFRYVRRGLHFEREDYTELVLVKS